MRRWSLVIAVTAGLSCAQAQAQTVQAGPSSAAAPTAENPAYTPPSSAQLARFEAALAAGDRRESARILDELTGPWIESNRTLRPNPLLNGLAGRFHVATGEAGFGLAYLRAADAPDVPEPQRSAALIALAEAEMAAGRLDAAALVFRRAGSIVPEGPMRARLGIANARSMLIVDPRAALARLRPMAATTDPELRFEALLAIARAHALLGEEEAAAQAGEQAWTASAGAPLGARATTRAALVLGGLAARRGDEEMLLAMLVTAGAAGAALHRDVGELLPFCGTSGVTPDDYVIFTANSRGAHRAELLEPVAASRAEIVRPFFEAMAGRRILERGDGGPAALIFTARCRSTPSDKYVPWTIEGAWGQWFAAHGIFRSFAAGMELDDIALLSARVGRLEAVDGNDPRLIGLRLDLATRLAARALGVGDAHIHEATRLHDQAMAGIRRLGAAEDILAIEAVQGVIRRGRGDPDRMRGDLVRTIAGLPIDIAYVHGMMWLIGDSTLPDETALPLIRDLLARLPREMDPRRRALTVRLAELQHAAGDVRAARATGRSAGIAENDCRLLPHRPVTVSGRITNEEYPPLAVETGMGGAESP